MKLIKYMQKKFQDKLRNYLDGLAALKNPSELFVGCIIYDSQDQSDLQALLEERGIKAALEEEHRYQGLWRITEAVRQGELLALRIEPATAKLIIQRLHDLIADADKQGYPADQPNMPSRSKIFLLAKAEEYAEMPLADTAISFCRLADY
jgi:hypothetical protein